MQEIKDSVKVYLDIVNGKVRYNCSLGIGNLVKYYNYNNRDKLFFTDYKAYLSGVDNLAIGHHKEIYEILKGIKDNLNKCSISLDVRCRVNFNSKDLNKDGKVEATLTVYTPYVDGNYYRYNLNIDSELRSLLDSNELEQLKKPGSEVKKDLVFKAYNIVQKSDRIEFNLGQQFQYLANLCDVEFDYLHYRANKTLSPMKTPYYEAKGNDVFIYKPISFAVTFLPEKFVFEPGQCNYNVKKEKTEGSCVYLNVEVIPQNQQCSLNSIRLYYSNVKEIFYDKKAWKFEQKDGYIEVPLPKTLYTQDTNYEFKVCFNSVFDREKEDVKSQLEIDRTIDDIIKSEKSLLKKNITQVVDSCDAKQLQLEILSKYKLIVDEFAQYDKRKEFDKIAEYTTDAKLKDMIQQYINEVDKFYSLKAKIEDELASVNLCLGKVDLTPLKNQLLKVKSLYEQIEDRIKQLTDMEKMKLKDAIEKAKQYYELADKMYRVTNDPYWKSVKEKLLPYISMDIDKINDRDYKDLLKLEGKLDPSLFKEIDAKVSRDFLAMAKKTGDKKAMELYEKYKDADTMTKIKKWFLEDNGDGKTAFQKLEDERLNSIADNVKKQKLLTEVSYLERKTSMIPDLSKRNYFKKILNDVKKDIENNNIDQAEKKLQQVKEEIKKEAQKPKVEKKSNTWLWLLLLLLLLLIAIGVGLWYAYKKGYLQKWIEKFKGKKEGEEEDDDELSL